MLSKNRNTFDIGAHRACFQHHTEWYRAIMAYRAVMLLVVRISRFLACLHGGRSCIRANYGL